MHFDLILAGGGLAGGLIAYRLAHCRPDLRIALVEAGERFGGVHTWSFFATDVEPQQLRWLDPFIAHRWQGYSVRFPAHERALTTLYHSITAERFDEVLRLALPRRALWTGRRIETIAPDHVTLAGGERLSGGVVIDCRGADGAKGLSLAWQKFVGLEVETDGPHGLAAPVIMDATVPQHDGYRFVYTLPLAPDRLLIEDTYYADEAALDRDAILSRIRDYAGKRGWRIAREVRREEGVLPIGLGGDLSQVFAGEAVPRAGMRAALFHPLTGYSLPDAAKAADRLANLRSLEPAPVRAALEDLSRLLWKERRFHRLLSRMLFRAARPERRYKVLERFYRLPQPVIERLYSGRTTPADERSILVGRPPVSVLRALAVMAGGDR